MHARAKHKTHAQALRRLRAFFPKGVVVFFSDNAIDFSLQKTTGVLAPRRQKYLKRRLGAPIKKFFNIRQVHGKRIVTATLENFLKQARIPKADGAATCHVGIPLVVRTADCLPTFIFDPKNRAIAIVHVGWRGAKKDIVAAAVKMMRTKWGSKVKDLKVAFGPAIRSCCYQVGKKFSRFFPEATVCKKGSIYFDLPLAAKKQFIKNGVASRNIHDCNICACCNARYFSYRRDGKKAGRMAAVMMLV